MNQHAGFMKMAHTAYGKLMYNNQLENQLIARDASITSLDQAKEVLMQTNQEYKNNAMLLEEYASVGILENMTTLQQAYQVINDTNRIEEQQLNFINKGAEELSKRTGMNYDQALNLLDVIPVGNMEESLENMNIANDLYNNTVAGPMDTELGISLDSFTNPEIAKIQLD